MPKPALGIQTRLTSVYKRASLQFVRGWREGVQDGAGRYVGFRRRSIHLEGCDLLTNLPRCEGCFLQQVNRDSLSAVEKNRFIHDFAALPANSQANHGNYLS